MTRGQIIVENNPDLVPTINKHPNTLLFPQIECVVGKELSEELQAGLLHYNAILDKNVVLLPKTLIMKIMDGRMYWGNITLQSSPELEHIFEEVSRRIGVNVNNIIIECIDDRNPNGNSKESTSFGPRIPGGALLGYAQSTQLAADFLNQFGIDHETTFDSAFGQYQELGGLSGHVGQGGHDKVNDGRHCECGCGAIKGLLKYVDADPATGLGKMSSFLKQLMNYNNVNKDHNPSLYPEYVGSHATHGGMTIFKTLLFDKNTDPDGFLPYTVKNDGVFSYNRNIQRKFITAEVISLINFVLEKIGKEKRNDILNKILTTPGAEFNVDKQNGHIMLNEHNRTMMRALLKRSFVKLNDIVIHQAAANVPAITETYGKALII